MYIIFYLLSIGTMLTAMFANVSVGGVVFLLLMTFLFLIIGTMSLLKARLDSRIRSEQHIISPEELRHIRQQAEKNKQPIKGDE